MVNVFVDGAAATKLPLLSQRLMRRHPIFQALFVREDGSSSWVFLISGRACALNSRLTSISHTQPTHPRSLHLARHLFAPHLRGIAEICTCTMRTATAHASASWVKRFLVRSTKQWKAQLRRGLDFIAISDHNTISHFDAMRELQPYFDNLLLIPAREITTFQGHANVYGTTEFIDFRLTSSYVPDINQLLKRVQELHGIFSINHPGLPSGESCMGCGWTVPNTDFSRVTAIEVVNGDLAEGPGSGISFWQEQMNKGFRLTGLGGSDNHDADLPPDARSAVGRPTTVIYAPALSERAILDAIQAGHVFIDVEGTKDRIVEFEAKTALSTASMGDSIDAPAGQQVHFTVKMIALQGAYPEIIQDGETTSLVDKSASSKPDETRGFDYVSDGKRHWFRVNVRSTGGSLLIVGNPIYLNF